MANCARCGKKLHVFTDQGQTLKGQKLCWNCYSLTLQGKEQTKSSEPEIKITLTTGDIKEPYEILDTIIALDAHQAGYFDSANPSAAFDGIKTELRTIAYAMGADAVISCQFEYRVGAEQGLFSNYFGNKQFIEIFAYGTAVKLKNVNDSEPEGE